MLWLSIALAVVISLAALAFVLWPILRRGAAPVLVEDDRLTDLLARKDAVLASIKELEFDYHVGKVSEEDLALFNERLRRQAIGLMKQIEKVAPVTSRLDDQLEREIAKSRKTRDPRESRPAQGAVLASNRPSKRVVQVTPTGDFCVNCGQPIDPTHKFCGHCGTPIAAPVIMTNSTES